MFERCTRRLPVLLLATSCLVPMACPAQADAAPTSAQTARHDAAVAGRAAARVSGPASIALSEQAVQGLARLDDPRKTRPITRSGPRPA